VDAARAVLVELIEYELRPSDDTFQRLKRALVDAGAPSAAAERVCRCVYFSDAPGRSELLAAVPPAAVGLSWAGRVLHESGRTREAIGAYHRALEAEPANPRTRLLYGIALIEDQRPREALGILFEVPPAFAPPPVAYWRGRALLDSGDAAGARRL